VIEFQFKVSAATAQWDFLRKLHRRILHVRIQYAFSGWVAITQNY
jgi:hypothetical protein